jgi:hypothetical protein
MIIYLKHTKILCLANQSSNTNKNKRKSKPREDFLPCMEGRKMRMKFRTPLGPNPRST